MRYKFRKPYRVKRRKSIWKNRFFWFSILSLIILGGLFYLFLFSEIFQIKNIVVTGEKKVSKDEINLIVEGELEKKLLFSKSKNIFLVNSNKIREKILNKLPQIEEIEINQGLPDTLNLVVIERKEIGCFCRKESCFFFDKKGIIFEKVLQSCPLDLVIKDLKEGELILGENIIEENLLSTIKEIQQKIKENIETSISEFNILEEKLVVKTTENWEIYFNPEKDINWQLTQLELLLESKIPPEKRGNLEYIDLRFSKIFWKFR